MDVVACLDRAVRPDIRNPIAVGVVRLQISSRVQNREFMAHITYTLSGLPPGKYLIDTTLRDAVSGKNGVFTLAFVIQ